MSFLHRIFHLLTRPEKNNAPCSEATEDAYILSHSPYQLFFFEKEAASNDPDIAERQEHDGRWKATARADASKYMLRDIPVYGHTEEAARHNLKKFLINYHRFERSIINRPELYTRVNVIARTNNHPDDAFSITNELMRTIIHTPGIESDIITKSGDKLHRVTSLDQARNIPCNILDTFAQQTHQVTWTTANLRKYDTALFASPYPKLYRLTSNNNDISTMDDFLQRLNTMGHGTITCTIV